MSVAGSLNGGDEAPEAASHCLARIWLAGGAADGIDAAGAGSAATGDFIPVYRVRLRMKCGRWQRQAGNNNNNNNNNYADATMPFLRPIQGKYNRKVALLTWQRQDRDKKKQPSLRKAVV
jgi:hypothetical protein